ncbi:hypothetical protein [Actinophytocola sp.]|uniref:hypothetical protein n=1 Tax=Actinophytocola sp. TaxID=1872138 RepID=UPI002ED128BD
MAGLGTGRLPHARLSMGLGGLRPRWLTGTGLPLAPIRLRTRRLTRELRLHWLRRTGLALTTAWLGTSRLTRELRRR